MNYMDRGFERIDGLKGYYARVFDGGCEIKTADGSEGKEKEGEL